MKKLKSIIAAVLAAVMMMTATSFTAQADPINSTANPYSIYLNTPLNVSFVYEYRPYPNDDINITEAYAAFVAPTTDYYQFTIMNPLVDSNGEHSFAFVYDSNGKLIGSIGYDNTTGMQTAAVALVAGNTYYIELDAYPSSGKYGNYYRYDMQFLVAPHIHNFTTQVSSYGDGSYTTYYDCPSCYYFYSVYTPAPYENIGSYTTTYDGYGNVITTATKPKKTSISKLTPKKKAMIVKVKKVSNISGYQVQLATDSKFKKNKKTVTYNGAATISKNISGLKAKKKYYVRVRTYTEINGSKTYSAWSSYKTAKTK